MRAAGAVPAAIGAARRARWWSGPSEAELARLGDPARRPAKAGARDLAPLLAARRDAGTTVSATAAIAARVGIRLFATGGIGGVHRLPAGAAARGAADVSADLGELARSPVCVVSAGPKAILDLPATAEALETLGVPVIGFRTGELPAFFTDGSGVALEHRVEDAAGAAAAAAAPLGRPGPAPGGAAGRGAARAAAARRGGGGHRAGPGRRGARRASPGRR